MVGSLKKLFKLSTGSSLTKLSDEELIKKYKTTLQPKIVAVLMDRYADNIAGISINYLKNEHDAEDLIQEFYLKLIEKLKYGNIKNFKGWLLFTLKNHLIDTKRRKDVRKKYIKFILDKKEQVYIYPINENLDKEQLNMALNCLKDEERACIEKIYLMEMGYKEIMEENNWTFNQIRGYRDRAIKKLKTRLHKSKI